MKVIKSEENLLEFDNGLRIIGEGKQDCCAYNFIDFEQFLVGDEFEDMDIGQFLNLISIKDDGFVIRDINGIPKWAQARSNQNGYYSNITQILIEKDEKKIYINKEFLGTMSDE